VAAWRYRVTDAGLPVAFGTMPFFMMCNAAIHRSVFETIGAFDETLTHGGEEVDFSIRAQLAGYEIGWVPEAVIHYRHRTTLRQLSRQFFNWGRATTAVYARHHERAALPPTSCRRAAEVAWAVVPHVVNVARGSRRRGQWVRVTSFYAGEVLESFQRGIWHLG
jgi:GT2 family glycosyltransferase